MTTSWKTALSSWSAAVILTRTSCSRTRNATTASTASTGYRSSPSAAPPSTNSPQQVPLVRFDRLSLLTVSDVLAAGMRLEPTGRNPRHYTVGFDDLADGVQRLVRCPHQVVPNAYHDA